MKRIAIALLLVLPLPAHAGAPGETPTVEAMQPPPPPPPPPPGHPRTMWTLGLVLRSTGSDPAAHEQLAKLDEYGWDSNAPMLFGLRGDAAYLEAPIVDLGGALTWVRGNYAHLPAMIGGGEDITGSTIEAGAFARVHWVKPTSHVAAEPRVELGLARTSVNLRGDSDARLGFYTRIGLDFRLGGRRGGAMFSLDYTRVFQRDDSMVELPLGGISASLSFYLRRWRAP